MRAARSTTRPGKHSLASAFHDTIRVKAFFNKMAAKDDHTRILPLSESHVAVDISRIEQATATAEDARERIESLKIDRSSSAFLKALKSDHELWLMFLEFFNTEEAFLNLLEKRRYASVLSGLMKAFIDHDVYLEHKKKDKKLREDAEFVENHKAYALAKSKGFDLNPIVSLQAKQPALQQSNKSLSGKYRSNATLLDPHDAADKELIRTLASPRTESHQYELVTETKRPTETQCPSSTRVLPKYDLERIKQMATEAESEAKASQTRASRHYKPVLASQKAFAEDTKHPRHRLSDARPQELGTEHHSDMKAYHQGDQFVPGSPNRENSPSKLHMKRQEFKQRKSGQKSSSNSPESQKEQARSDSEKKLTFMEKMMNFDYSNLRKPRIETDNQITSKLAQDKKNRQLSREKRVEDIASADEHSKSPKQSGARPGRYAHAHSDEEMKVNHKKRDDHLLEYSDNDDDPLGFPPGTFPKHKVPGMRNSSPGYPPRSPDQYSNKSNNISQNASKQADATRPSAVSRDKKKLTPLVPDSEKSDVYSKVQKHLNQKEHEQKAPQGGLNKSQEEKPRSASGGSRPPRERRHPNVDHRNPEYVPAHLKEQKRYLAELEKPSYKSVKSSNYGKIEPNKDGSSKGGILRLSRGWKEVSFTSIQGCEVSCRQHSAREQNASSKW
jgi:hypothetical protein